MCIKQAVWKPLVNAFATMCGLVVPIALAHAWCAFSLLVQEEVAALSRATPFRRTITCGCALEIKSLKHQLVIVDVDAGLVPAIEER